MTDLPHFTLPFRWQIGPGYSASAAVAEQDSVQEIESCCEAIIRTVQGQRTTLPPFGRPELEFNTSPAWVRSVLAAALIEWEPRVQALIAASPDAEDSELQVVRAFLAPADDQEGDQA